MGDLATRTRRVDVRPWPGDASIAHLVLLDVDLIPSRSEVARWTAAAFDHGRSARRVAGRTADAPPVRLIRTGALFPSAAASFEAQGFEPVAHLALLERLLAPGERLARPRTAHDVTTVRMRTRDLPFAAGIDASAFPAGWQNDERSLADIRRATPSARARLALFERRPMGLAITGRAGPNGYVQRVAVHPDARRLGLGRLLVLDALRWLARRATTRVLVNTDVENHAALALYASCGFHRRDDDLVVMERRR